MYAYIGVLETWQGERWTLREVATYRNNARKAGYKVENVAGISVIRNPEGRILTVFAPVSK